jgi:hypothetical protein
MFHILGHQTEFGCYTRAKERHNIGMSHFADINIHHRAHSRLVVLERVKPTRSLTHTHTPHQIDFCFETLPISISQLNLAQLLDSHLGSCPSSQPNLQASPVSCLCTDLRHRQHSQHIPRHWHQLQPFDRVQSLMDPVPTSVFLNHSRLRARHTHTRHVCESVCTSAGSTLMHTFD